DLLDHRGESLDLGLRGGDLLVLRRLLLFRLPPEECRDEHADEEAGGEEPLSEVLSLEELRGLGLADRRGAFAFGEQVDLDHRPSPPPSGCRARRPRTSSERATAARRRRSRSPCT